ncbi:HD domain-containing protein [Plantactinospora sp. KBS50]|uniref:HD domain-containing protein n=1 Tax=Plantactinospora sp. KBS50 TaxID=2024580 RepID=UPI000BAAD3E0|nr:HD domain-containing protein [Plantactinospora sp. KBS50]ASW55265.1 phosphohydrolase [Plantactinospora sp. KBS50]
MDLPGHLGSMPMHAITEIHGESGLLERFRLEIERFDPPARRRLTAALELAAALHRDDRRVREPYLNHLLRVAIRMMHHYQVRDVDVIVAGLLHDTVEDHPAELAGDLPAGADLRRAALAALADRFGARVARLVAAVTNPEYDPDRDRNTQYREHVAANLEREPWARVIKVSDFTDNGVGIIHTVGPKVLSSAVKYRPLVPVLRDLVARADTPLAEPVKQHIYDQLDLAEERFSAILDAPSDN